MRVRRGIPPALAVAALVVLAGCTSAPSSLARPATEASAPTPTPSAPGTPVVATIGDSIMSGHGLEDGADWPTLMSDDRDDTVVNVACSGAGFIAVGSCGSDFAGLIPAAVKDRPAIVIVQGSDNDHTQSAPALDAATRAMIDTLHRALPEAQIVGLNTLWDQPTPAPAEIAYSSASVRAAVTAVGGVYVDIGQPLQGRLGLLQPDDEHPTVAGQQVLLQAVEAALDAAGVNI